VRYCHVALYAEDLRAAEPFYGQTFAADVLFREAVDSDGVWHALPLDAGWEEADVGLETDGGSMSRAAP
jgi:predicted enzyme related to lactoylglutathione lyase